MSGNRKMRRIGSLLAMVIVATLGVVTPAAGIRELPGSPYRIGSSGLVFSPDGRWLVTLDSSADGDATPLWVMSVNTKTGELHRARGAPLGVGGIPQSAAFSRDGRMLAVSTIPAGCCSHAGASGPIVVFSVNSRTGALHQVSSWSDPIALVDTVAFSPRGGLLAAEDDGSRTANAGVTLLTVNRRTGALRYASRWAGPSNMGEDQGDMTFNPSGSLLALLFERIGPYDQSVEILSVNHRTLTPLAHDHPQPGAIPGELAFSPDGSLIATTNTDLNTVSVLRLDQATGALPPVPGSPFDTGVTPESLAFSPDGGLLAVADADGPDFSVFSVISGTGSLHPIPGSPFGSRIPDAGANAVAFSPRGNLLAYGTGFEDPYAADDTAQDVQVFSAVFCDDPDHDGDCDPS